MATEMEELREHGEKARELRRAMDGTTGEERMRKHDEWQAHVQAGKSKFYGIAKPKPFKHVPKQPTQDRAARLLVDQRFAYMYMLIFQKLASVEGIKPGDEETLSEELKAQIANKAFDLTEEALGERTP